MTVASATGWRTLQLGSMLAVVLALIGATYQGITTARERRALPHPGRLVDVGGYQLHIRCAGEGDPTVILESPGGGLSTAWDSVQHAVARVTRVCAYDRAGLGWSEAGAPSFDPGQAAPDLATLLSNAGERPPFVLVGHGLGTTFAGLFAAHQPARVPALVIIDDPSRRLPLERELAGLGPRAAWLARFGVLRAWPLLTRHAPGDTFSGVRSRAFLNRPDHLRRATQELARLTPADVLTDLPGVRVTHLDLSNARQAGVLAGEEGARVADAVERVVRELRAGPGR